LQTEAIDKSEMKRNLRIGMNLTAILNILFDKQ